jgi:tetratricopeptide (TPR) repeat protein
MMSLLRLDGSPLIRASAADAMEGNLTPESVQALLGATRDGYRLVRVRAASSLAGVPAGALNEKDRTSLTKALAEWEACLRSRPDDFASRYNLGNYYLQRGRIREAIASFERSIEFHPENYAAMVNVSMAYNAIGDNQNAEKSLRRAIAAEPNNPAAFINLGMLLGELDRMDEAEKTFREALRIDPNTAVAAYNLGIILASSNPDESLEWSRKAFRLRPDDNKYGYTYAWYLHRGGQTDKAITVLKGMLARQLADMDVYMFLGAILERGGELEEAAAVYRRGAEDANLSMQDRSILHTRMQQLAR